MKRALAALCVLCIYSSLGPVITVQAARRFKLPTAPSSPNPANGAVSVGTSPALSWNSNFATSYDVYFGTAGAMALVSSHQTAASYTPAAPLANGMSYSWQIIANNANGSTTGAVWSFTTAAAPQPPGVPGTPSPTDGATNISTTATLMWSASGATTYDVSIGTTNPPPVVATALTSGSYSLSGLAANTTYYWQVVATNTTGSATGPIWTFQTAAAPTNTGGATWIVNAGGDLQAALNSAQPGDTILLQAGATFSGNFVLPAKSSTATSYITIRSSAADSALPPPGTRINPAYAPQLPKLRSPNTSAAVATAPYAHHYRFELVEFMSNAQGVGDIILLGDGSSAQNTLTMVPHDLVLDRVYVHGDTALGQKRGVALNSAATTIENSYISDIKSSSQDSQAIAGWNGPGPYTITNNYLEAAGENVLFGGADPAIPQLVPSDITVTGNHLAKQLAWKTQSWIVKNLFELKNAQRVTVDGNVMEYNWSGAQPGYSVLFTPRNQSGTAPWSVVQHVAFTNNVVRHVSSVVNILGTDDAAISQLTNDLTIRNNLFVDVSGATYGGSGRMLLINGGANITIDHNTVFNDGSSTVYAYGTASQGFVFTNNILPDNAYGIMGDNSSPGNAAITKYFPNSTLLRNIIVAAPTSSFPTGNYYPATIGGVGFVDYSGGNYRLAATSPYHNGGTDGSDVGCNIDAVNAAAGTSY